MKSGRREEREGREREKEGEGGREAACHRVYRHAAMPQGL